MSLRRLETRSYPYAVPIKTSWSIYLLWPQLATGSGKGQNPALIPLDHRDEYVGARRLSNQNNWLAVDGDDAALVAGFSPKGLRLLWLHLPRGVPSS